ncbi:MAG: amidase [Betaproteobacteria bacterium]
MKSGRTPDQIRAFMAYPESPVAHADSGDLLGLSFAVKDLFDVAGYPTSGGQPILLAASGIKTQHARLVDQVLAAGASFVGKTVTDELAFSLNGSNAHFGAPINGAAPDRLSGGSSSGSASAVSLGCADFALGTDTGGSVRAPASHCGLIGLRPTHGRLSSEGCLPLAPSLDVPGWFAKDIEPFAAVGKVLLGADTQPLKHPRMLMPTDLWELLTAEAAPSARAAVEPIQQHLGGAQLVKVVLENFDAMTLSFRRIQGREAWESHGDFIERYSPVLGPGVAERFAWSKTVTLDEVHAARSFRAKFVAYIDSLLGANSVLIFPTMPDCAPMRSTPESSLEDYRSRSLKLLCVAGLSGCPQISLPLVARAGVPLGISILGPRGSDQSLIALAQQFMRP